MKKLYILLLVLACSCTPEDQAKPGYPVVNADLCDKLICIVDTSKLIPFVVWLPDNDAKPAATPVLWQHARILYRKWESFDRNPFYNTCN